MTLKKWQIIYETNLKVERSHPDSKSEIKSFKTLFGVALFIMRNKKAKAAHQAGRLQIYKFGPKK